MTLAQVDPYRTKLHHGNAYHCALASDLVYLVGKPDGDRLFLAGLQTADSRYLSVTSVNHKSTQGALIEHEDYLMYVFAGTNEMADILDNINVSHENKLGGFLHRGFYNAWNDVWEQLKGVCDLKLLEKRRPILITGHSLGAALATVTILKFILEDWAFSTAYLFGSPRVLERETSRMFNTEVKNRVFRFQNRTDIVSRVPMRLMRYSHVGTCLFVDEDDVIQSDIGWWWMFVSRIEARFNDLIKMKINDLRDHARAEYMRAVVGWKLGE